MFGEHRRNRRIRKENKRKESQLAFERADREGQQLPVQEYQNLRNESSQAAQRERPQRDTRRQEHMRTSREEVTQNLPGLTDQQRLALQEKASAQINRDLDRHNREILSNAGSRGIRGGSVYAQQKDLAQRGLDARRAFERDLAEKDIDLQQQRLAAVLSQTEGKVAQDLAEEQKAQDWLEARREQRRQQALARARQQDYNRV